MSVYTRKETKQKYIQQYTKNNTLCYRGKIRMVKSKSIVTKNKEYINGYLMGGNIFMVLDFY